MLALAHTSRRPGYWVRRSTPRSGDQTMRVAPDRPCDPGGADGEVRDREDRNRCPHGLSRTAPRSSRPPLISSANERGSRHRQQCGIQEVAHERKLHGRERRSPTSIGETLLPSVATLTERRFSRFRTVMPARAFRRLGMTKHHDDSLGMAATARFDVPFKLKVCIVGA